MNTLVVHANLLYRPGLAPAMVAVPPDRRAAEGVVKVEFVAALMIPERTKAKPFAM